MNEFTTQNEWTMNSGDGAAQPERESLVLTILHHPDTARVGEQADLSELDRKVPVALSRAHPDFCAAGRAAGRSHGSPLLHSRLSRKPVWLSLDGDALLISLSDAQLRLGVDGHPVHEEGDRSMRVPRKKLRDQGVFLELMGGVLLWLHEAFPESEAAQNGILGLTPAMRRLQDMIARVAPQSMPVLIRGESGVGKELVAGAIHKLGPRASQPCIAVNMAAIPVSMAAAELFGHCRGAFTGAERDRKGWFEQAHGGTLFLDEIGETPLDIQPQLLRALDSGEIQPVGQTSRKVDVRLIAATDANLEALVEEGRFRRALLHRIQSAILDVPPLRQRRADIPILMHHFLREQLAIFQADSLLLAVKPRERPWLGLDLVMKLLHYRFPGNVRELRNICSQIAIHSHDRACATLPDHILDSMVEAKRPATESGPEAARPGRTGGPSSRPGTDREGAPGEGLELTDDVLLQTLQKKKWNITRTARAIGLSKNALTARLRKIPGLRLAGDLGADEIRAAMGRLGNDVDVLAPALKVSAHGLRLRMHELGLR